MSLITLYENIIKEYIESKNSNCQKSEINSQVVSK